MSPRRWFAVVDADLTAYGVGTSEARAEADAARWLEEAGETDPRVVEVTEAQAQAIRGGNVSTLRRRPAGRPAATPSRPATAQVQARIPEDTAEALRARAEATGRSVSVCVREAVEKWLSTPPSAASPTPSVWPPRSGR